MSTVDAYKFYTTLLFSIKSKVISYATKCNLASTVDINNKVVSYRQTIQSNSAEVRSLLLSLVRFLMHPTLVIGAF